MAELYRNNICSVDINKSLNRSYAGIVLATGDKNANRFGAILYRDGVPVEFAGQAVVVTGYFVRPDGYTVVCEGVQDGNVVYVDLPAACYTQSGAFSLAIKVSSTDVTQTVRVIDGVIRLTQTDTIVDPGEVVPSLDELLMSIAEMEANKLNAAAYGLPMLYLKGDTAGMSKDNAVTLDYEYKGRQGTCEVKWQGSSSLQWPKKNYTIKFDEAFEAVEGWGAQKKYCFKANFIDHSHARNIGSCKLWGEIVKSRGLHSTLGPHATNPWLEFDYYSYRDGVYTAPHSAAMSGKGRYCINGFTLPSGRYDIYLDVFMPSGGSDKQVICSLYAPNAQNALALNRPTTLDAWERVALLGIDARNLTSPCHLSIQGRETEGMKFKNVVIINTETNEEMSLPAPAWQIKDLPNGGAIDGFPCVIMLNGEFHGLYTWNIPKDGWMLGTPKAILCADLHCDATKFKALATLDGDFELEYVEDEDNADWVLPSLNRAIQSVINSNGGDLDTVVGQYIDIPSAIDYYIHTVDESAADGTSKNYLLFTFDGVKWYFGAYDRDTTYGLYWDGKNFYSPAFASVTYAGYANHHALMNLIYTHKKAALKSRAIELRDGIKSAANVATVFSNFVKDIPSQVLDEDARKWPTIPSTSASNLAQIQSWYIIRRQIIDKEIDAMA